MSNTTYQAQKGISWQKFENGLIVINPKFEKVHQFNQTASYLFEELISQTSTSGIIDAYGHLFQIKSIQAAQDMDSFIKQALEFDLLTIVKQ